MRAAASVLALVVAAAVLAGCMGKRAAPPTDGDAAGRILGTVVDSSEGPVEGASARVLLTDLAATTGPDGRFDLRGVPPGPFRLVVAKDGFATATRTGTLGPGGVVAVHLILVEVRVPQPSHRTHTHSGQITCGLPAGTGCGAVLPDANTTHRFAVDADLQGIVFELEWTPQAQALAPRLSLDVHAATAHACGDKYANATGPSVLRLVVLEGFPISGGHQCAVVRAAPDAATVQQAYTLHVTLFFHAPPPDGFSALT